MKSAHVGPLLAVCLIVGLAAAGCRKNPKPVTVIEPTRTAGPGGGAPSPLANSQTPDPGLSVPQVADPNANRLASGPGGIELPGREEEGNFFVDREVFKEQTVYYDFDRSEVKSSERSKLDQVAAYLRSEPSTKLRVEGHCDERGTPEYNRSLGERRALSAREYLVAAGISAERIGTLSWGEDKPADPGQTEEAYAKNRRGEFILLRPKQ